MTAFLLDADVLIALAPAEHTYHNAASRWIARTSAADAHHAICPTVEGATIRYLIRLGVAPTDAQTIITEFEQHFALWPDDLSYSDIDLGHVQGHRKVTDTYLAGLAAHHNGILATFDSALAASLPDLIELIG